MMMKRRHVKMLPQYAAILVGAKKMLTKIRCIVMSNVMVLMGIKHIKILLHANSLLRMNSIARINFRYREIFSNNRMMIYI